MRLIRISALRAPPRVKLW